MGDGEEEKRSKVTNGDFEGAVCIDNSVGEVLKGRIWDIVKRLQLHHHVVEVEEGAKGLGVRGLIHTRREEDKGGVVLTLHRLPKLRRRERNKKQKERERGSQREK